MSIRNKPHYGVFLAVLLGFNFFWLLGTKVSDLLLDLLLADLGGDSSLAYENIQTVDSIFNFTVAGAVLLWGYLVDRFPNKRRLYLIINNILWIGTNFFLYISDVSLVIYLIVQILWGITIGANGPLIFSYLGDLFRVNIRGRLFAVFATGLYLIKGASNAFNGILGNFFNNWKTPNMIMAIGGIILLILYSIFISDPQLAQIEPEFSNTIAQGQHYQYTLHFADIKQIIKQPTNRLFLIQGFFGMIGVTIVTRYLFYWINSTSTNYEGMGMETTLTVMLLAISGGIGALCGINIAGWFADRQFRHHRLDKMLYFSILCLFGQILSYALLVFLPEYPSKIDATLENPITLFNQYPVFWQFFVIFNICLLFSTGIGPVVGVTRTHLNLPEHRGTAAALYDTTDFIGAGAGLLIGTILIDILQSFRLVIFYGAFFWIISGVIWIFITRFINRDYEKIRLIMQERVLKGGKKP